MDVSEYIQWAWRGKHASCQELDYYCHYCEIYV